MSVRSPRSAIQQQNTHLLVTKERCFWTHSILYLILYTLVPFILYIQRVNSQLQGQLSKLLIFLPIGRVEIHVAAVKFHPNDSKSCSHDTNYDSRKFREHLSVGSPCVKKSPGKPHTLPKWREIFVFFGNFSGDFNFSRHIVDYVLKKYS